MFGAFILASQSGSNAIALSLIGTVGLLLINAVFVAYEFAVIAARRATIEAAAEQGKATAKAALDSFQDLSLQLAGAQLGITMASLGLGWVGEPAVASVLEALLGDSLPHRVTSIGSFAVALAIVVFLHLVIGEMVPKNIAIARPEPTLRLLVLPYRAYLAVVRPLVFLLNAMANLGCRLVGVEPRDELVASHSAAELADIVTHSSAEGAIESDTSELLRTALLFAEMPIGDIARPLTEDSTLRLGSTASQAERIVELSGRNRVPVVVRANGDTRIEGYLHAKDLLRVPSESRHSPLSPELMRRMAVLEASMPLIEALRSLRRTKRQMAVVVVSHGGIAKNTLGVLSLEDIVSVLVQGPEETVAGD